MFGRVKLRCPKFGCGGKAKPRKHYEKKQCKCRKCGYIGLRWEFIVSARP